MQNTVRYLIRTVLGGPHMAKTRGGGNRSSSRTISRRQRVVPINTRPPLLLPVMEDVPHADRRRWNPTRSVSRPAALTVPATRIVSPKNAPAWALQFQDPSKVVLCAKRQRRKEVMFAKRLTGKGAKSKVRKRNAWSRIKC